jgi:hypothetical protein
MTIGTRGRWGSAKPGAVTVFSSRPFDFVAMATDRLTRPSSR